MILKHLGIPKNKYERRFVECFETMRFSGDHDAPKAIRKTVGSALILAGIITLIVAVIDLVLLLVLLNVDPPPQHELNNILLVFAVIAVVPFVVGLVLFAVGFSRRKRMLKTLTDGECVSGVIAKITRKNVNVGKDHLIAVDVEYRDYMGDIRQRRVYAWSRFRERLTAIMDAKTPIDILVHPANPATVAVPLIHMMIAGEKPDLFETGNA